MNYLLKFGIEYNPFIKNNKQTLIDFEDNKQLMLRLKHLESIKGIGLITGDSGLGKTTSIRTWKDSLNKNNFNVIYIQMSTLTVLEFYRIFAYELGLEPHHSKRKNFTDIQKEITRLQVEKRITTVLIIDEANYLSSGILNDLKILMNFDIDSKDHMICLLVGQNTIRNTLKLKAHEALRQRISINYMLNPLEGNETKNYIDTKLKSAGCKTAILSDSAYQQIINASLGVPRIINQIMDKSLLILSNNKAEIIDEDIAMNAINEYQL